MSLRRSPVANSQGDQQHPEILLREFTLATAFALAFGFISPIVGLYSILGLGLTVAGPSFWFAFPLVLVGQILVALVFGMLASRYPYEGSIYQWSGNLIGPRYAWFAGWAYAWALPISMGAVALAGSHFLAELLGLDPNSPIVTISLSAALLAFATWGNTRGRFVLNAIVALCIGAEIIASVGVGFFLLIFHRHHPLVFLLAGPVRLPAEHPDLFHHPIAMAVAIAGWALLGFESAGSVAEEVRDPQRVIPRAMIWSLISVAMVVAFSALALILAIPDEVLASLTENSDPVALTLTHYLGVLGFKAMLGLFMIGFIACLLGTQASVSRVIWAFARNNALPFSGWLKILSTDDKLPINAILVTSVMASVILLFSLTNIYSTLVAFTTAGFYIAFAFPLIAALIAKIRGTWQDGPFHLGVFTGPVIYCAAVWIVFETINIGWPRSMTSPWYENWAVVVMAFLIGTLGLIVRRFIPPDAHV